MKVRIVETTELDGRITYTIQQKCYLSLWIWTDAGCNREYCQDTFGTLERAKEMLCYFNGSRPTRVVIYEECK